MAAKHPVLSDDEICCKKLKISKRLRPKACTDFVKRWRSYIEQLNPNAENTRVCQIRSLLISNAYLTKLCWKSDGNLHISLCIYLIDLNINFLNYKITFDWTNYQHIISIIRLFKLNSMQILFETNGPTTSVRVSSVARLCKAIRGLLFYYLSITTKF
jgi:hypothetical protein